MNGSIVGIIQIPLSSGVQHGRPKAFLISESGTSQIISRLHSALMNLLKLSGGSL